MSTTDQVVKQEVPFSPEPSAATPYTGGEEPSEFVYDLRLDGESSQLFYSDVSSFSARVLDEIDRRAGPMLDAYSQYVAAALREPPRSRGEYALELLTVGMAVRLYGGVAASTPGWVVDLARELYWMRRRSSAN
jgi:hypothetical protein